jgi:4-methyl-5(b-hydroxyethyl)-thiazole monophosphate biosynthesis
MSNALVIIMDGVEELEAMAPVDLLRRAGADVTVASTSPSVAITGRNGIRLTADTLLPDTNEPFDLIIVPGGPGHKELLENKELLDRLVAQNKAGRLIGSICAGPLVLKKAGLLEGKLFTAFPGTAELLPERDPDSAVVVDGNLITSQGAGTAIAFALALVEGLLGADKRREIAASICAID